MDVKMLVDHTPKELMEGEFKQHEAMEFLYELGILDQWATDYGEPGYRLEKDTGAVMIGDWWCKDAECDYPETNANGKKEIHEAELHYHSLFKSLTERGFEAEWSDEWTVDSEYDLAYRIQPDSYSWESSVMWSDEQCELLTPNSEVSEWIEEMVNNPRRALPSWWDDAKLEAEGFTERECGFEAGWYNSDDNPVDIMDAIKANEDDADVLFKLSGVEQFRVKFCVFVRPRDTDDE